MAFSMQGSLACCTLTLNKFRMINFVELRRFWSMRLFKNNLAIPRGLYLELAHCNSNPFGSGLFRGFLIINAVVW